MIHGAVVAVATEQGALQIGEGGEDVLAAPARVAIAGRLGLRLLKGPAARSARPPPRFRPARAMPSPR